MKLWAWTFVWLAGGKGFSDAVRERGKRFLLVLTEHIAYIGNNRVEWAARNA